MQSVGVWKSGCPVALDDLRVLELRHWNYQNEIAEGHLVVHRGVAEKFVRVFARLFAMRFQIEKMLPIENFKGSDAVSMRSNNTSAFNCRPITGKKSGFSPHSYGDTIDINPLTNPYVKGKRVLPKEGVEFVDRTLKVPGILTAQGLAVRTFKTSGLPVGWRLEQPQGLPAFRMRISATISLAMSRT